MIKITELFDIFNDFSGRNQKTKIDPRQVQELEGKIDKYEKIIKECEAEIKRLEDISEEKEKAIIELEERNMRMQADYKNFERILNNQKNECIKFANKDILKDIITIKEDLERAIKQNGSDNGLQMIYQNLLHVLKKEGIEEIKTVGEKFDFNEHEVLMAEESEEEDGIILEEFEKGYKYKDKILKPAKVKISKN